MTIDQACRRPGCGGHYAEDGYCDECGHKAPAGLAASPSVGAPSVPTAGFAGPTGAGLAGRSGTGTARLSDSQ